MKTREKYAATLFAFCILHFPFSIFHSPSASAAESEAFVASAPDDIRSAFTEGGPVVSCWNVQTGWNLRQQIAWIRKGHRYFPAIYVPLAEQGANNRKRWEEFYRAHREDLSYINKNRLPVTLRWHNWLAGFYDKEQRNTFERSPLVHIQTPGGLEDLAIADPFGPLEPWSAEGQSIATTYWVRQLAAALPDVPRLFFLENNEAARGEFAKYTTKLDAKDKYGYPQRVWKESLETLNLRVAEYAKDHDPVAGEIEINRRWKEKYAAMHAAILENAPAAWRGKIYFGGYSGLLDVVHRGDGNYPDWNYERPQDDWENQRWDPSLYQAGTSRRLYDDGGGDPHTWHDWVRGQVLLEHNLSPLIRELAADPLWHDDISFWISPNRSRLAAKAHGGYVLPERLKGFARAALWANVPKKRATCLRWFAGSKATLTEPWFKNPSDPAEVRGIKHIDYFAQTMEVVDEVWRRPELIRFWREGEAVINPDPPFCKWTMPPDIVDDRNRALYTDADPPRFQGDVDLWRKAKGKMELKVFSQAFHIRGEYLVYAWSPRETRENVTVQVPGLGGVLFDRVDPDGEWRLPPKGEAIH